VNRQYRSANGDEKKKTIFLDIDALGRQSEVLCQHLHKGDSLMIEGRLSYRSSVAAI
jgi:single-strand DNA-binding protein